MSDTIDEIEYRTFTVPPTTGPAEVVHYAVWYPDGGYLEGPISTDPYVAVRGAYLARAMGWSGALALKITIERLDL